MSLIYNATFDKNTRKLSFEDRAGNEIYSFTVPEREKDDLTKPLTFKATQDGSSVTLKKKGSPTGSFQTSRDGGNTWSDYTLDTAITLNIGDEVSFRAKANRTSAQSYDDYFQFVVTGKIEAWHNVMSLYRTNDFATYNTVVDCAFRNLFNGCISLTKAPALPATTLAKDCFEYMFWDCRSLTKAPELPATTLASGCYASMFCGCKSLTKAPELPATTLAQWCYYYMFNGCPSLTKAPELPATTLAPNCYQYMFTGCRSLTEAPELPATTLADDCYDGMFERCTSLAEAPELPATTLANNCYHYMFMSCTSLTKAPALPATTLTNNCYAGMFNGCTSLTKAPELPATTLASGCYSSMFNGCTSLTKAPELPATTLADACYYGMFWGCQSLTKAPELPATTLANYCYSGMFYGCGSLNEVRCQMPSTISAEDIPKYTTNSSSTTTYPWLSNVASTGTFYTNADANWPSGVSGIPTGWTRVNEGAPSVDDITKPLTFKATQDGSSVTLKKKGSPTGDFQTSTDGGNTWSDYTLDTAITLNTGDEVSFRAKSDRTSAQNDTTYFYFEMGGKIEAWHNVMSLYRTNDFTTYDTVVDYAFSRLFEDCTSLTKAPALPATTLANSCYSRMFKGCTSLTKAPALPATDFVIDFIIDTTRCYDRMFWGCTSLTEAPELPATRLSISCYYSMFEGCTSLTKAPELPATALEESCYESMFSGCSSLTEAPELPATTLAFDCYSGMFNYCTSLVNAPALPATTLKSGCYNWMFARCIELKKSPELTATKLANRCYNAMFYGCGSLNEVRCQIPSTISAEDIPKYTTNSSVHSPEQWLGGVASTGTFYTNADANWPSGASGIPTGWTRTNT